MSSNLAVSNFVVSGTLGVTGKITLSETITSSSSSSFVDLSTTNLPTCDKVPSSNTQLTNKLFVDNKIATVNSTITSTDNSRKTYIDNADGVLNTRITSTDAEQKTYIDTADGVLNTRITSTDASQKTYIDQQIGIVTSQKPLFYVHQESFNTQTIPNNTMTLVSWNTELYNVLNKFRRGDDLFTGFGFGGYYQFNSSVCLPNITSGYIAIFKNNVEFSRGSSFSSSTTSVDTTLTISTIMYVNGTNDEIRMKVICSPSTVISGSISKTYFNGHFIQA